MTDVGLRPLSHALLFSEKGFRAVKSFSFKSINIVKSGSPLKNRLHSIFALLLTRTLYFISKKIVKRQFGQACRNFGPLISARPASAAVDESNPFDICRVVPVLFFFVKDFGKGLTREAADLSSFPPHRQDAWLAEIGCGELTHVCVPRAGIERHT